MEAVRRNYNTQFWYFYFLRVTRRLLFVATDCLFVTDILFCCCSLCNEVLHSFLTSILTLNVFISLDIFSVNLSLCSSGVQTLSSSFLFVTLWPLKWVFLPMTSLHAIVARWYSVFRSFIVLAFRPVNFSHRSAFFLSLLCFRVNSAMMISFPFSFSIR